MLRRILFVLLFALPVIVSGAADMKKIDISDWHDPVEGPLIVTDVYGVRDKHPVTGKPAIHEGIDLRGRGHVPVYAVTDGEITIAKRFRVSGKMIELDHGDGVTTRYMHLSKFAKGVKSGKKVKKGQIIGYTGNTGRVTFEHLHFEIRIDGESVDPFPLFGELPCKHGVEHPLCQVFVASLEDELAENPTDD